MLSFADWSTLVLKGAHQAGQCAAALHCLEHRKQVLAADGRRSWVELPQRLLELPLVHPTTKASSRVHGWIGNRTGGATLALVAHPGAHGPMIDWQFRGS